MDEFDIRLQDAIARQRAGQQAAQSFEMPKSKMVGGRYIRPSFGDALIQGLRMVQGAQAAEHAGNQITELTQGRQKAIAEALRNFGQQAQGVPENAPGDGMGPVLPGQAPDMMGAYQSLLNAPDAGLRQMALQGMARIPEAQAQREARADEVRARAEQRAQELQAQHQMRMEQLAAQNASREQMAQQQREFQREMLKLRGAMRPEPAPRQSQIIQTDAGPMQLVDGKAVPIMGADGKPLPAPKKGAAVLSPTAQKELFEADDAIQNGIGAVDSLRKAMELNNKAYSGFGASARATLRSNLPGASQGADATIAMENIIKDQALTSMKSIFGGNPTEGERAILLDLQASANKTPKQREEILTRAMQAAQRRLSFNQQKAESLRSGSYMTGGGAPQLPTQQPALKARIRFDAQGNPIQ